MKPSAQNESRVPVYETRRFTPKFFSESVADLEALRRESAPPGSRTVDLRDGKWFMVPPSEDRTVGSAPAGVEIDEMVEACDFAARIGLFASFETLAHQPFATVSASFSGPPIGNSQAGATYSVGGRGRTAADAIRGCIMEAAETAAFLCPGGPEPDSVDRCSSLLADLLHLSERQRLGGRWTDSTYQAVRPFVDPQTKLRPDSIEFISAESGKSVLVAADLCLLNRRTKEGGVKLADSNGLAASVHADDAVERAVAELVERDAFAIWWYNRIPFRPLPLDTVLDGNDVEAVLSYQLYGRRRLRLFDVSPDTRLVVCCAVSWGQHGNELCLGSAARPTHSEAAAAALAEMCQLECDMVRLMSNPAPSHPSWRAYRRFWSLDVHTVLPFLTGDPDGIENKTTGASDTGSVMDDLAKRGIEILLARRQIPGTGYVVAKAIAPQLRHWTPGFGPGRLYDVPVKLGWLKHARSEMGMNPVPILF